MSRYLIPLALVTLVGCPSVPLPTPPTTPVPSQDREAVVRGATAFALDLYQRFRMEEGRQNLFFSPWSVSVALAMTQAGARGATEEQMAGVLRHELDSERLHPAYRSLLAEQVRGGGEVELSVGNALWGQRGLGFQDDFLELTRENYGAGLQEVDFQADPEAARTTINDWVEDMTQTRIKDLIAEGDLTSATRLVLTNAVYFKGRWASEFDPSDTQEAPFFLLDESSVQVPLMHQTETFRYGEVDDWLQVLELPYRGDELHMVILLPRQLSEFAKLEETLTASNLDAWLATLSEGEVSVDLPRFKLESAFSLSDTLIAMGMGDAFDEALADFSGMTGRKGLFITSVRHKAFVEVDEQGTVAAAATDVAAAADAEVDLATFRADHPFVFLIRDRRSGSILFLGRLVTPELSRG